MTEKDWLDSQEFYELMHGYRHTSIERHNDVVAIYEHIKDQVRKKFKREDSDKYVYVGDLFIHQRNGITWVCNAITKSESGTTVELSPYVRDQK